MPVTTINGREIHVDAEGFLTSDLHEAVEGIIGAGDFIEKTEGAQLLFI